MSTTTTPSAAAMRAAKDITNVFWGKENWERPTRTRMHEQLAPIIDSELRPLVEALRASRELVLQARVTVGRQSTDRILATIANDIAAVLSHAERTE